MASLRLYSNMYIKISLLLLCPLLVLSYILLPTSKNKVGLREELDEEIYVDKTML